jgi:acyl-CoA synthetase (AMP-forming)/AMP-acid ligase II
MLAMLLADDENVELMKSTNVKIITLSGAPTSESLFDRICTAFPNARVQLTYGMSETGPGVFDVLTESNVPKMSVGRELPHIQYKLVDDVLYLKFPGLFNGYHGDEDKTKASYDEDGFFNTRDKFRVDENGFYYFIGRADDMFVSGGENIYPAEVEEILNSHPCVSESYVIGLDDEIKGTKAYAFVIMRGEATEREIQDYYATRGPAYQIPRKIWPIKEFPVNYINKVDRLALVELAKKLLADGESE